VGTVEKWLTGVTVVAVVATVAASPYSAGIFNSIFGGIAGVYRSAKK
jgi:hypothetical protein